MVKRAHTVKFNDPFELARTSERKVGPRTVFRRSRRKEIARKREREREGYIYIYVYVNIGMRM